MRAQLYFVLSQITHMTDGQTDTQTDSFLVARPHCMQCMQRGKMITKRKDIKQTKTVVLNTVKTNHDQRTNLQCHLFC